MRGILIKISDEDFLRLQELAAQKGLGVTETAKELMREAIGIRHQAIVGSREYGVGSRENGGTEGEGRGVKLDDVNYRNAKGFAGALHVSVTDFVNDVLAHAETVDIDAVHKRIRN